MAKTSLLIEILGFSCPVAILNQVYSLYTSRVQPKGMN